MSHHENRKASDDSAVYTAEQPRAAIGEQGPHGLAWQSCEPGDAPSEYSFIVLPELLSAMQCSALITKLSPPTATWFRTTKLTLSKHGST